MTTPTAGAGGLLMLPAFVGAPEVNRVYCVDALTLLRALPTGSVDLIITSPPYDNLRAYHGYSFDFEPIAHESYRVLKQGGVLVWVVGEHVVCGHETLMPFKQAIFFQEAAGFNLWQTLVWEKVGTHPNAQKRYPNMHEFMFVLSRGEPATFHAQLKRNKHPGRAVANRKRQRDGIIHEYSDHVVGEWGMQTSIWNIHNGWMQGTRDKIAYKHPAMFPEKLAERHILTWSNPDDLVLDYFGGSGTTSKMARANGRRYLTCDISADYCDLMRKRLAAPYTLPMFAEVTA